MLKKSTQAEILNDLTDCMDLDKADRKKMKKYLANSLTVGDLIESLKTMNPDLPVELKIFTERSGSGGFNLEASFPVEVVECSGNYDYVEIVATKYDLLEQYAEDYDFELLDAE